MERRQFLGRAGMCGLVQACLGMFRHVWETFRHVLRCAKLRQTNYNFSWGPYPWILGSRIFLSPSQEAAASSGLDVPANGG